MTPKPLPRTAQTAYRLLQATFQRELNALGEQVCSDMGWPLNTPIDFAKNEAQVPETPENPS